MAYKDSPVTFKCNGDLLLGIVSSPIQASNLAVIIIVGGPQYRVGSHRQFIQLAHTVANAGFTVLRFDVRGMGDSEGELRNFTEISDDIRAAKDYLLCKLPHIKRIVLWGLCDGATAALIYFYETRDSAIVGMCLLNPWIRLNNETNDNINTTPNNIYYKKRLRSKDFWLKLASGKIASSAVKEAITDFYSRIKHSMTVNKKEPAVDNYNQKVNHAWNLFDGNIFLILSENDLIADEFLKYARENKYFLRRETLAKLTIENSNHTFSDKSSKLLVELETIKWLYKMETLNV